MPDRTTIEVDHKAISHAKNEEKRYKRYLGSEPEPKKKGYKDYKYGTIEKLIATFTVEPYLL
jgi:hypothetical protein